MNIFVLSRCFHSHQVVFSGRHLSFDLATANKRVSHSISDSQLAARFGENGRGLVRAQFKRLQPAAHRQEPQPDIFETNGIIR